MDNGYFKQIKKQISGSEVRDKIINGEKIPDWLMRNSIYGIIKEESKVNNQLIYIK